MSTMSNSDQQVWKKVLAAKNKNMTQQQIEASFPSMGKKQITSSIASLIRLRLLSTTKAGGDDRTVVFHASTPEEAKQKQTLTQEQKVVLHLIGQYGNRGLALKMIGRHIGNDVIPAAIVRKTLKGLESSGLIKQFKPVNAPTTVYYCLGHLKPPEEISGGVWFDDNKEYDQTLVETVCQVLLSKVQSLTYVDEKKRSEKDKVLISNALNISSRSHSQLTPHALRTYVNNLNVTTAKLSVKNVMECMRALELDGLVEVVKPIGGVYVPDDADERDGSDDDDVGPSSSKRRKISIPGVDSDEDLDDEERERRRDLAMRKAKEKAKEKKRREKLKVKEKEKKEKKKRKEEKQRKEKEKKRRKKEKDKKKKKKRKGDDSDAENSDDDMLVSVLDEDKKKKKKKRRHSISSSSSSFSSDSSSDSDSDSDSSSDSESESDTDSVSSVSSSQLDTSLVPLKPSRANLAPNVTGIFAGGISGGLTDLTDTAVIYRATNRLGVPLGQTQAPCGKCPVFSFCEEGGPVEPEGCNYYDDWLADTHGGWDEKALKIMKPELDGEEGAEPANGNGVGETMIGDGDEDDRDQMEVDHHEEYD
ncbi:hypothetical protein IAR55_007116 [Kwoniella newhampshirensis]|uniref:DNA-directed RNA polymerase III subunit RPC6 n=1 Tax=Kwoniella newhampshirensis TaxID=1651941 RepID=A0AAW0YHT0_9TREE